METEALESVTAAAPVMHASTSGPSGIPAVQSAAVFQSPDEPPPVQLSLQVNDSVGGALPSTVDASNTVVVPATTTSPATTAPTRCARCR